MLVWGAAGGGPIPDYIVKAFLGNVVYGMDIQAAWTRDLTTTYSSGRGRISPLELEQQTSEFVKLLSAAASSFKGSDITPISLASWPSMPPAS